MMSASSGVTRMSSAKGTLKNSVVDFDRKEIILDFHLKELQDFASVIVSSGVTKEELSLMSVMALMDDTLRLFLAHPEYGDVIRHTYEEIKQYLALEGVGH